MGILFLRVGFLFQAVPLATDTEFPNVEAMLRCLPFVFGSSFTQNESVRQGRARKKNRDVQASGHQSAKGSLWSLRIMKSKWFPFPQSCLSLPLVSEASLLFHSKTQYTTGAKGQRQEMSLTLQPASVYFTPCYIVYCAGASSSS